HFFVHENKVQESTHSGACANTTLCACIISSFFPAVCCRAKKHTPRSIPITVSVPHKWHTRKTNILRRQSGPNWDTCK
uniref:Uncharacterized protein n=1 Tax=Anopheles arabiensis TaxID=7173 RepID=A0A182IHS8_ANOAR